MKHYPLTVEEMARHGFTDLFVIPASDLTVTTNDLLQNISLITLNLGDVVKNHTTIQIKTLFAPVPSANAVVTLSVGRTGTGYTDFIAASNLVNSTAIPIHTCYAPAAGIADAVIAADSTVVYAQFDITDTDGNLATMTAGEVWVWLSITKCSDRARAQA